MKKRLFVIVVVMLVVSCMLVACGPKDADTSQDSGDTSQDSGDTSQDSGDTSQDSGDSSASGETEVNILCFQGYTEPDWVEPFQEMYGVTVNATYAGTVEEMFTKAMAGGTQYDIVSIDCGSVQRYYDAGIIDPIDQSKIANYDKLSAFFKDADYKMYDGEMFHVPMVWGSNNFVYNMDALPDLPQTWSIMWDPAYAGKISVTDEANNMVVCTAIGLGFEDPYNLSDEEFAAVKEKLVLIAKNCRTFSNGFDNEKQLLQTGETEASISGYDSGLVMYLRDEAGMNVGRMMPEEGIYAWIDGWVMLKDAANPETAHKFMDWMLADENQVKLAEVMSFGAVTPAAKDALDPDIVRLCAYDDIDKVPVPVFVMKTPEDFERRVNLWNEAKAEASQ